MLLLKFTLNEYSTLSIIRSVTGLWDIPPQNMLQCDSDLLIIPFIFQNGFGLTYSD